MKKQKIYLVDNCFWIIDAFGVQKLDVSEYTTVIAMGIDKSERGQSFGSGRKRLCPRQQTNPKFPGGNLFRGGRNSLRRLSEARIFRSTGCLFSIFSVWSSVRNLPKRESRNISNFCPLLGDAAQFQCGGGSRRKSGRRLKMRSLLHNIPAVAVESKLENFEKIYG